MIARNQLGEAYATTSLKLRKRRDDFRGVLGKKESKSQSKGFTVKFTLTQHRSQL